MLRTRYVYNILQNKLNTIQEYIANILKKNQICFLNNFFKFLVLFIKKSNNSLRLCINSYKLNKTTIKNKHSFSFLLKMLERFANTKCFTKINIRNTYYCIQICQNNK